MTISILGYDPKKKITNDAVEGYNRTMEERDRWEVNSMNAGKMNASEINQQTLYHELVDKLLYNPMFKIELISMGENDGHDTIVVTFQKQEK